jgi:hypothetical protein
MKLIVADLDHAGSRRIDAVEGDLTGIVAA